MSEKIGSKLHAMLPDMGSQRAAVHGAEYLFQGRRVHMEAPGELVDRDTFIQVLNQIVMHLPDNGYLVIAKGGGNLPFLRAGNAHDLFEHLMQNRCGPAFGGTVKNLFAFTAAFNQAGVPKTAQVMRNRGTGHVHKPSNVDDAFFAVAEQPENPDTGSVTQLRKYPCDSAEFVSQRERLKQLRSIGGIGMPVGKYFMIHFCLTLLSACFAQKGKIFAQSAETEHRTLLFRFKRIILQAEQINKRLIVCHNGKENGI